MVNKVILIGNVGMDPEVRTTEGGVKVARLRLATTERLFDRQANETREHTGGIPSLCGAVWPTSSTVTSTRGLRFISRGVCVPAIGWTRTITSGSLPRFSPIP